MLNQTLKINSKPHIYQKILFTVLMIVSFDSLAVMACTYPPTYDVGAGNICVYGPDDPDDKQKDELRYLVAKKVEAKYGGSCSYISYSKYINNVWLHQETTYLYK
jgi:hypothetical protein